MFLGKIINHRMHPLKEIAKNAESCCEKLLHHPSTQAEAGT